MRHEEDLKIDKHIGFRIRQRRTQLGLTQQNLANMLGITLQQQHKYETSVNRVSAGRLFVIAQKLHTPVTFFYEGSGEEIPAIDHSRVTQVANNFSKITNTKQRETISRLIKVLAEGTNRWN